MKRLAVIVVVLGVVAVACAKSESPPATAEPRTRSSESATPEPTRATGTASGFTLGEATVIRLLDKRFQPTSVPLWRLHADGKSERFHDKSGTWEPDVEARPDGTIWLDSHELATVSDEAITYDMPDGPKPIAIDGNTVSVVVWQKAHDGEDFTAKIELGDDGAITVHHRDGTRIYWRIDAADPAVRRTAFHVFALQFKSWLD